MCYEDKSKSAQAKIIENSGDEGMTNYFKVRKLLLEKTESITIGMTNQAFNVL